MGGCVVVDGGGGGGFLVDGGGGGGGFIFRNLERHLEVAAAGEGILKLLRVLLVARQPLSLANLRELSLGGLLGLGLLDELDLELLLRGWVDEVLEQTEDASLQSVATRHAFRALVGDFIRLLEHLPAFLQLSLVRCLVVFVVERLLGLLVNGVRSLDAFRVFGVCLFILVLVGRDDAVHREPECLILEDALELGLEIGLRPRGEAVAEGAAEQRGVALLAPPPGPTPRGGLHHLGEFKLVLLRRRLRAVHLIERTGRGRVARRLDRRRERVSLLDRLRSPRPSARHALVHARSAERRKRGGRQRIFVRVEHPLAARDDGVPGGAGHPHRDGRVGVLVRGVHARAELVGEVEARLGRGLGAAPALFGRRAHGASLNLAALSAVLRL